ncbi:MAG: YgaP family membrane protein [Burkholderiaceae bacterium]
MNAHTNSQAACGVTGVTTEKVIRAFAGGVILLSLALGASASPIFHSAYWLWVTVFVGANLLQSAFTGLCPLNTILTKVFHVRSEADIVRAGQAS